MEVFNHHIYEFKKGLRRMVLYTSRVDNVEILKNRLETQGIDYFMTFPGEKNVNVFFGDKDCVEVIRSFNPVNLTNLSLEEDFILGAALGYDIKLQCQRYLKRLGSENTKSA
jgi:hypothetical protein